MEGTSGRGVRSSSILLEYWRGTFAVKAKSWSRATQDPGCKSFEHQARLHAKLVFKTKSGDGPEHISFCFYLGLRNLSHRARPRTYAPHPRKGSLTNKSIASSSGSLCYASDSYPSKCIAASSVYFPAPCTSDSFPCLIPFLSPNDPGNHFSESSIQWKLD